MVFLRYLFISIVCLLNASLITACGYHFQDTKNPLRNLGIEKIYVESFTNKTFRPGIEQYFSSAMIQEIEKSKVFRLVNSKKDADAVLRGEVFLAESSISSRNSIKTGTETLQIAQQYNGSVSCAISLQEVQGTRTIFSQTISGSKTYPGSAELADTGATVSLVNESEQRLAYQFLATQMMESVYQRMVDIF